MTPFEMIAWYSKQQLKEGNRKYDEGLTHEDIATLMVMYKNHFLEEEQSEPTLGAQYMCPNKTNTRKP